MAEVTISSKFQIVIPTELRKQLKLKAGQKLQVIAVGEIISLVPIYPLSEMRGTLKGMDTCFVREDDERL